MNNMKSNIINIEKDTSTFLKGLAILLVVLSHMGYVYRGGTWGVNIFLILSGYGVFQSYLNKGTAGYFRNKIKKVYFPYLMVTIFVLIYSAMKQKLEIKMIVFSLLGLDFGNLCDKTMWFVSYIFAQYVIFYLSTLLFGRIKNSHKKHFLMILFCFIVSIALLITDHYCGIWGRGAGIFLYSISFSFGMLLAAFSLLQMNERIKKLFLVIIALASLLICFLLYNNINSYFSYFVYGMAFPLLIIAMNELKSCQFNHKWVNFIGEISYDIYLWEGFLLSIKDKLFETATNELLVDLCVLVLCIIVAQTYRKLVIQPLSEICSKE